MLKNMHFDRRKEIVVFLFFLMVALFSFGTQLFNKRDYIIIDNVILDAGDEVIDFNFTKFNSKSLDLLWNPYFLCGAPLLADLLQYNILSPITMLRLLIHSLFEAYSVKASNCLYFIILILMGFSMYRYSKSIGLSRFGAVISGLIFSHISVAVISNPVQIHTYAFFPLVLLCFEETIAGNIIRWDYAFVTGVIYGLQFLGGGLQYSYYFTIFFVSYSFFRLLTLRLVKKRGGNNETYFVRPFDYDRQFMLACFLIFIIGVGIFMVQFLPTYELAKHTARFYVNDYNRTYVYDNRCIDIKFLRRLFLLPSPWKEEYFGISTFAGAIPFLLVLLALFVRRKSKICYFYLFTTIVFLIIGSNNFIIKSAYAFLPFFTFLKAHLRVVIILLFCLSILAGYGERLLRPIWLKLVLLGVFVCSLNFYWHIKDTGDSGSCEYWNVADTLSNFQYHINDKDAFRIIYFGRVREYERLSKFYYTQGRSNLLLSRYLEFTHASINVNALYAEEFGREFVFHPNYLKITNTKYIVIRKGRDGGDDELWEEIKSMKAYCENNFFLKKVFEDKMVWVYELKDTLPRAFFVSDALCIKDKEEMLALFQSLDFNPEKIAVFEELVGTSSQRKNVALDAKATIIRYTPSEVEIELRTNSAGFLILSDTYYPGWKGYVNNIRTKIYRANYLFRGLYIDSPGVYIINFRYRPFSFYIGAGISLVTICICGYFLVSRKLFYLSYPCKRRL